MTKYTKEQIEKIISEHKFEYQKIELPFDLSTPGSERDTDLDTILGGVIENKSVLDIGSAYGYFCFEAEKRGASYVCGTELKEHRFKGAELLKDIKNSSVDFLNFDILEKPINKKFDIVLLLNVIHHLEYPIYFLKLLSEICTEKLVIEFPTTNDEIYNRKYDNSFKVKINRFLNRNFGFKWEFKNDNDISSLPLIGVSLMKEKGQTFVFNESALERILIQNSKLFKRVEFFESNFSKERKIGVFYK